MVATDTVEVCIALMPLTARTVSVTGAVDSATEVLLADGSGARLNSPSAAAFRQRVGQVVTPTGRTKCAPFATHVAPLLCSIDVIAKVKVRCSREYSAE